MSNLCLRGAWIYLVHALNALLGPAHDSNCSAFDVQTKSRDGAITQSAVLLQKKSSLHKSVTGVLKDSYDIKEPASWAAQGFGPCILECGQSKQVRAVECRSFFTGAVLPDEACSCLKPVVERSCACGVHVCVNKSCQVQELMNELIVANAESVESEDCAGDFEELGCLPRGSETAAGKGNKSFFDRTCIGWNSSKPCRSGLPFYKMHSDAMSPALCLEFCVGKGLDVAGIADGEECRCGASTLNSAAWHMVEPRQGLFVPVLPTRLIQADCHVHLYRYMGYFEMGAVPNSVATGLMEQDLIYIDSVVKGRDIPEEFLEDGEVEHLSSSNSAGEEALLESRSVRPGWHRPCWPSNCGPGTGLWPRRIQQPPVGVKSRWEEYVVIKYKFDENVDERRREALLVATERWRKATCIYFVEGIADDYDMQIGIYDNASCYVTGLGYSEAFRPKMNLGWCNSARYVGSIVHELGHIVGMNHEQKRPDATATYHGKGPYLKVHWDAIQDEWKDQFKPDMNSYMGSQSDGNDDPHAGYAEYDFGSIMHYPAGPAFDTIPASGKLEVGNRNRMTKADILQVNDMYQCKSRRNNPAPSTPTIPPSHMPSQNPSPPSHKKRQVTPPPTTPTIPRPQSPSPPSPKKSSSVTPPPVRHPPSPSPRKKRGSPPVRRPTLPPRTRPLTPRNRRPPSPSKKAAKPRKTPPIDRPSSPVKSRSPEASPKRPPPWSPRKGPSLVKDSSVPLGPPSLPATLQH